eukprot:TRINITY_DN2279_c0_g2_i2.p1 TRINITY_DN2279_c0_g2~~TRINITY_DN2279_c0_g2_i2.p1  ORF type:complete len:117 (+),score=29.26 TRINITY_DN2279_c0_g2_i2:106-456(+)
MQLHQRSEEQSKSQQSGSQQQGGSQQNEARQEARQEAQQRTRFEIPQIHRGLLIQIALVVVYLVGVRLCGYPIALGQLPGDIYYSSPTTMVSMPLATGMIFQVVFQALMVALYGNS